VIGFVPEGSSGLLKLRLARREGRELVYVGRVGTGWDRKIAGEIRRALEPLARPTAPLMKPLKKRDTTWVEPRGTKFPALRSASKELSEFGLNAAATGLDRPRRISR
jgi:bifunctional non-homologous end joining protein LigD